MVVEYTYTRLGALFGAAAPALQSTVHVYGVVVGAEPATSSSSEDSHTVRLADETLGRGQTVLLRVDSAAAAPHAEAHAFRAGCVLRVHRAAVRSASRSTVVLRGRVAEALAGGGRVGRLSWLVFGADTGAVAAASSPRYTFTPRDQERVQQLLLWHASQPPVPVPSVPSPPQQQQPQQQQEQQQQQPRKTGRPSEGPLLCLAQVQPTARPFSCIVYVCPSLSHSRCASTGGCCDTVFVCLCGHRL